MLATRNASTRSSSITTSQLLVSNERLQGLLFLLSDVTAICGILNNDYLCQSNVMSSIMSFWHDALGCAAGLSSSSSSSVSHVEKERGREGGATSSLNQSSDVVHPPSSPPQKESTCTSPSTASSRDEFPTDVAIEGMLNTITSSHHHRRQQQPDSLVGTGIAKKQYFRDPQKNKGGGGTTTEGWLLLPAPCTHQEDEQQTTVTESNDDDTTTLVDAMLNELEVALDIQRKSITAHLLAEYLSVAVLDSELLPTYSSNRTVPEPEPEASTAVIGTEQGDDPEPVETSEESSDGCSDAEKQKSNRAIPFRWWMDRSLLLDPTLAALHLLAYSAVAAKGVFDIIGGDAEAEKEAEPTATLRNENENVIWYTIVISSRPVAPCSHVDVCFGNQQFLFVKLSSRDSNGDNNDEAEEDDEDRRTTVQTVLSQHCSLAVTMDPQEWGWDETVRFGHLLEHVLPSQDKNSRPWSSGGNLSTSPVAETVPALPQQRLQQGDGAVAQRRRQHHSRWHHRPSAVDYNAAEEEANDATEPGDNTATAVLQQFHKHPSFVDKMMMIVPGGDTVISAKTDEAVSNSNGISGPRAGDAMFVAETVARLDFWVRHGSIERRFDADFLQLSRHEQQAVLHDGDVDRSTLSPIEVFRGIPFGATSATAASFCDSSPASPPPQQATRNHPEDIDDGTWSAIVKTTQSTTDAETVTLHTEVRMPLRAFTTHIGYASVSLSITVAMENEDRWVDGQDKRNSRGASDQSNRKQRDEQQQQSENQSYSRLGELHEWKEREMRNKLRQMQRTLGGSVLSLVEGDKTVTASDVHCIHQQQLLSHRGAVEVAIMDICTDRAAVNVVGAGCSDRVAIELRKLRHKLLVQRTWRGLLWDPHCGRLKASCVCLRRDSIHANMTTASTTQYHSPRRETDYVLSLQPNVAPILSVLSRHYMFFVDLDRTIADTAIVRNHHVEVESARVSWLIPSSSSMGGNRGALPPTANNEDHVRTPSTPLMLLKAETVFLRPQIMHFLRYWSWHWKIPCVLATKSSKARSTAILAQLADPSGEVFGFVKRVHGPGGGEKEGGGASSQHDHNKTAAHTSSCPEYRIFSSEDLLPPDPSTGFTCSSARYAQALLLKRKCVERIFHSARCGDDITPKLDLLHYVVLDDTPHVWEEQDWMHVVPVAPFTLSRVDDVDYWNIDGVLALMIVHKILFGPLKRPRGLSGPSQTDDSVATSLSEDGDDGSAWWEQYVYDKHEDDSNMTTAAAARVSVQENEEDDDDDDDPFASLNTPMSSQGWGQGNITSSYRSSWANNPNVEDVIPL